MTKEEDCNYCVHQWYIGLYYKTKQKLNCPLFCEEHGSKKQTLTNVILKYSKIYSLNYIEKDSYIDLFL